MSPETVFKALARLAFITVLLVGVQGGCGGPVPGALPSTGPTNTANLDSEAENYLAKNGGTFTPSAATASAISKDQAVSLVARGLAGTPTSTSAIFGRLRWPLAGARSDRDSWFVVIDGAAPAGSTKTPRRAWAFIDAADGRNLITSEPGINQQ